MTTRKKWWLIGGVLFLVLAGVVGMVAGSILARRFEPVVRQQAIQYMRDRFHCDVQLKALRIHVPEMSWLAVLWNRGRGAKVRVDGEGISMRFHDSQNLPDLFSMRKLRFVVDLGTLQEDRKVVDDVSIEGMQINIPPKGAFPVLPGGDAARNRSAGTAVLIRKVRIAGALLTILPADQGKQPLRFQIENLRLTSAGADIPMKYDVALSIPKPPGHVHSTGTFGPWDGAVPGDTPLAGNYTFDKADLAVFRGIAGILHSSGRFEGRLASVHARGEASVPDFRLKSVGTPVPLSTSFEVLIDGTNGDTKLQPVQARLGNTAFTTAGAVIKHEKERRRAIDLSVSMPNGDLRDLLRLAMKGSPFMEGHVTMHTLIGIPPLSGTVKEKLLLDGSFEVAGAKFLRSTVQSQIDRLSRRGRGQPNNQEIDQVVSDMNGSFRLENQVMTFRSLSFRVPGSRVALAGNYDLEHDSVDFHGNLKLAATLSDTMSGWKRWALKPVDPFFSKHGAGTFLRIKVEGTSRQPTFGLDRGHDH